MPTYDGTLTPMVAWMPSASPAVSCGDRTSYSITSTSYLGPFSLLLLPRVALGSGDALVPHPPHRTRLLWCPRHFPLGPFYAARKVLAIVAAWCSRAS